ncbi:MAG: hypothetical protein OXC44_07220 [Proteobacteria bacterium]|nr:hypothetical protein [Pseudomonadota bacterium]
MFVKPSIKAIYHQNSGFSLVEIMMTVLIAPFVLFGIQSLVVNSQKELSQLQEEIGSGEGYKFFALRWSSITRRATLASHFQKIPVNFAGTGSCTTLVLEKDEDSKVITEKGGGPCFFKLKKSPKKEQPLCEVAGTKVKEIFKVGQSHINLLKDEAIESEGKEVGDLKYKVFPSIRRGTNKPSDDKYYVGWKVTKDKPFLLLSKPKGIDFTFSIPLGLKLDDGNYNPKWPLSCDMNQPPLYNKSEYILLGRTALKPKDHQSKNDQDKIDKDINFMKNKLMAFYVRKYPQIYTLKLIKNIQHCGKGSDALVLSSKGEFVDNCKRILKIINDNGNVLRISQMHKKYYRDQDNLYYVEIQDKDNTQNTFKKISTSEDAWKIKPYAGGKSFPVWSFSAEYTPLNSAKDPCIKDVLSNGNVYDTHRLFEDENYDSEIIGMPAVLNIIKIKKIGASNSKNGKRQLYNVFLSNPDPTDPNATDSKKNLLINNLRFSYAQNDPTDTSITIPEGRQRAVESVIIAREIGTRNLSVFLVDLDKNTIMAGKPGNCDKPPASISHSTPTEEDN